MQLRNEPMRKNDNSAGLQGITHDYTFTPSHFCLEMFESVIAMLVYLTQACVSVSLLLYQLLLDNSLPWQLSVYVYYLSSAPDPEH